MRNFIKIALLGSALAAAAVVNAQVVPAPSSGQSTIIFFVTDTANNTTYTFALNEQVGGTSGGMFNSADALSSSSQNVVNFLASAAQTASFSVSLAGDSALQTFITNAGGVAGGNLAWGIYGGSYNGGGSTDVQGSTVFLSTALNTTNGKNSVLNVGDTGFSGAMTAYNSDISLLNGSTFDGYSTANDTNGGTSNGIIGTPSSSTTNIDFYGNGIDTTTAYSTTGNGSRLNVYGLTPNGSGSGQAVVYELGYATFNGSTLTFTPVPLPAAAWLLCGGLLGLLVIGRRRDSGNASSAAAA
jgi:hypothetical protein